MPVSLMSFQRPEADRPLISNLLIANRNFSRDLLADASVELALGLRRQGLAADQLVVCSVRGATADLSLLQAALHLNGAALLPVAAQTDRALMRAIAAQTGAEWCWDPSGVVGFDSSNPVSLSPDALVSTGLRPGSAQHPVSGVVESADPLALVVQTSGSSGGARAAMISCAALEASCTRINSALGFSSRDLWLCCLPRQHIGGLAIGYRCAFADATMLLQHGFNGQQLADALWQQPVTHLSLVPPMLARLLEQGAKAPPGLRVVLMGGQALDAGLARRALDAGWPLQLGYGMTETCSFVASRRLDVSDSDQGLSPLPGVEFDCADCYGDLAGETARLRIRAPMLMAGYANPKRLRGLGLDADGWLRTSDLACQGDDGCLRILGRADERLVIAGVNVLPADIQRQLAEFDGIDNCAVCGVPEPVWGHTLVVLYQGSASSAALSDWCRGHLSSAHRPRLFVSLPDWPLLASGKSDRLRLRELAEEAHRQWVTQSP